MIAGARLGIINNWRFKGFRMDFLENRTYDEIHVGDKASLTRSLTEKDIQIFAIMSGDINPAHVDIEYAQSDLFHKIIGHGMWSGALISTVLGTQLPGPGTIYLGQTIRFKKPVAVGDTLTVTVIAHEKAAKNRIIFNCECRNQAGEIVIEGQAEVIAPATKIRRPKTILPEISLRHTQALFQTYLNQAKKLSPLRTGVIFPVHEKILIATAAATKAGLISPILIGPSAKIISVAESAQIDIKHFEMLEVENVQHALVKAMQLARDNHVEALVRGGATREELIKIMQKPDRGLVNQRIMSHALVVEMPTYHKPLILTDTLIHTHPSLETKRMITQNAIDFAHTLQIAQPKVAILAGADLVSAGMPSTIDAAALCKMAERGQIKGGIIDGPLTFDDVISREAAHMKGIVSSVVGEADTVIVPNLETGNILAEQLEHLAESRAAGLVLGAKVPVLMSHIDDIEMSTISCALAVIYKHHREFT